MSAFATLHARALKMALGTSTIFDGVDLDVIPGRRTGLVGPNGVGKSTLLKVIAGQMAVDAGSILATPPNATIGYLPQEPERDESELVTQYLGRRAGVTAAMTVLDESTTALAEGVAGADDSYVDALDRWLALGGADLESRVGVVWAELGLADRLLDQPMSTLSGGEAARVGLAALLLARFDVFLLDEPTNDLDLAGLARLETWMIEQKVGIVVVSHDREFLRRTITHVAELDPFTHQLSGYAGGWDAFLAERELATQHARDRYDDYADKKSNLLGRAQREREWATQGLSKAKKKSDDGDKHIKSFKINQSEQLAGKAARTERALERLDVVEEPREAWQLRMTFGEAERSGAVVARLVDATARVGSFELGPVSLAIGSGERIAIVGSNGSGKSTLLRVLLGRQDIDAGECHLGPSVVVGELEQSRLQLSEHTTLLEAFMQETSLSIPEARTLLAKFGIGAGEVNRPTASLSPGERTRAVLAVLMANGTNCLVLDEPTNHLDLAAIEQLESAIDSFRGTVLLVTHDRALLDHVRLTRRVELQGGRIIADTVVGG